MFNHLWNSKPLKVLFIFIPLLFLLIVTLVALPNLSRRQTIQNKAAEPVATSCRNVGETCGVDYKGTAVGDGKWCCFATRCGITEKDPIRRCRPRKVLTNLGVPAQGVLFGGFVNTNRVRDAEALVADTNKYESQLGRSLDINIDYKEWGAKFPLAQQEDDLKNGRVPLISWRGENTDDINRGKYDKYIKERAQAVKKYKGTMMIRWIYEMNSIAGKPEIKSPSSFVRAWIRIWTLFKNEGVTNVIWVWNPAVGTAEYTTPAGSEKFYPGNKYVDWIAFDGYDRGNMNFSDIFSTYYNYWTAKNDKPIMIAEFGTPYKNPDTGQFYQDGYRTQWFKTFESQLPSFPRIKAVLYWNSFGIRRGDNREKDMRLLDTNSGYFREFKRIVNTPYFNP